MALPVPVPKGQENGKDYFHHLQVSIETLNRHFEYLLDKDK